MSDEENANELVIIDYNDLISTHNDKLHPLLKKAFGTSSCSSSSPQSLGLIAIRNIPSFVETKESFLPLAHKLANLPRQYLDTHLTDEASMYNAGWSHGKEKLKDDKPDFSKGSFYFNPIVDVPGSEEERKLYPTSFPVNKWPDEELIPKFKELGKTLGLIMKDVVVSLANHIDHFVKEQCKEYNACIGTEMKNTQKVKGRLLYYFPQEGNKGGTDRSDHDEYDSWIGWHNDSGFLTALAGDLYVDHDTGEIIPTDEVDPRAGLYIQDRNGCIKHIQIPNDCMAVQIGECLQIVTGGYVVATPHCVRGADTIGSRDNGAIDDHTAVEKMTRKVARISFPCFVDTIPSFPLSIPLGRSRDDVLMSGVIGCAKVPPLEER